MFKTERLIFRKWQEKDIVPFMLINQDPKVIEFLRGPLDLEQTKDLINLYNKYIENNEFGFWALELQNTGQLIGFTGLNKLNEDFKAPFTPCVEIGWRLGSQFWGQGYAQEAALKALEIAKNLGLKEILSFTAKDNLNSRKVMERIGMARDLQGDFNHPKLSLDHKLSEHVLYRKFL